MSWNWNTLLNPASAIPGTGDIFSDPMQLVSNPTTPITGVPLDIPGMSSVSGIDIPGVGSVGDFTSSITDWTGLTDTKAGERGLEALEERAAQAEKTLKKDIGPVMDMYGKAMKGRKMGDVLDTYRTGMLGTERAAGEDNVQKFLNPMYGRAIRNATDQALAGAGSSLQSSAANQAVGSAVGNQVQNMWQQAFQNAMADAQNKQKVYGAVEQSDLMPSMNWAQLTSDVAGTKYTTGMDLAQAAGQVAGQNQGWFGNLF